MQLQRILLLLSAVMSVFSCSDRETGQPTAISEMLEGQEKITGTDSYLSSPFVSAGDRAYMVGHQDGTFPDLGWHVTGEMGGIWTQPLKLMDGFSAAIISGNQTYCLEKADSFVNYPFANQHIYNNISGVRIERTQYVPEGQPAVSLEYTFVNDSEKDLEFLFEFNGMTDLRPVWLGERTGMEDSRDSIYWKSELRAFIAKDIRNSWYAVFGSNVKNLRYDKESKTCDFERRGNGTNGSITWIISLPANSTYSLPISIAGSLSSEQEAIATYTELNVQRLEYLQNKISHYREIDKLSHLVIPDKQMEKAFTWVKYNTEWLVQEVPGVGRGLTAGIPDYPWWFGADSEYALQGAIMTGRREMVYETIDLLYRISEATNGNGRVVHEVSANGAVFNPGNINETPQFASLIRRVYQWTGDRAFLEKYYPFIKKGLNWLSTNTDRDGNLLPDGFGMMEIHGLDSEMIDVAAYTQRAYADAASMAETLGYEEDAADFRDKAVQLKEIINTDFWVEEFNSFADFIGTTEQAKHLLDDAIRRADSLNKPWAVEELKATRKDLSNAPSMSKKGFVLHHNWVVNTPMETGIADSLKATKALETGSRFVNPFGMFVTGIDRDETAGEAAGSFQTNKKIFSYIGAVMTLPTGVQAVAENNYGRPDHALEYLKRMTRSFSYALPGSMYEVSPDYGMMVQAWNIYSYAVPLISQFFGINPEADQKILFFKPQMPSAWNTAELNNVLIGSSIWNFSFSREEDSPATWKISSTENWQLLIPDTIGKVYLNNRELQPDSNANYAIEMSANDDFTIEILPN